jgi:AcrR family transcriptional regulator
MTSAGAIDAADLPVPNGRRTATRAGICAAAGALFFESGFTSVTMDEIAKATDIRRSTLYLHFRDKEEILAAIAEDYVKKLRRVVAQLPRPVPTHEEIVTWVGAFADFVIGERAATEVLVSLSHLPSAPAAAIAFGQEMKQMMGERLAAFRRAIEPGQALAYAWAMSTLDGLGWALCHHAREGNSEISRSRLIVAAQLLSRFVHDEF